jgi:hypothetical protein
MRSVMRNLIEKARHLSGTGAVRNAHLEVDRTIRSIVELDRQLSNVSEPNPRRAA